MMDKHTHTYISSSFNVIIVADLKESIVFMATRAEKLLDLSRTLHLNSTRVSYLGIVFMKPS